MNIELLEETAYAILDEPRKFAMNIFVQKDSESPCGTAACIAGHAVCLHNNLASLKELYPMDIESAAREALDINYFGASDLFYMDNWPEEFYDEYRRAVGNEERAEVAFWRIQHFIASYESTGVAE